MFVGEMRPSQSEGVLTPEQIYPLGDFSRFVVASVPLANQHLIDGEQFIQTGLRLMPNRATIDAMAHASETRAGVCLGDLGLFTLAATRNGEHINHVSPELNATLLKLAHITGLPPRDNYYSYTDLNFPGANARTYLGSEGERLLVDYLLQFKERYIRIINAVYDLIEGDNWANQEQQQRAKAAAEDMNANATLMIDVRKSVSPEAFADRRRIVTTPITVEGAQWRLPDGTITSTVPNSNDADSTITLLDALLYGMDDEFSRYVDSLSQYFPHSRKKKLVDIASFQHVSLYHRFIQEPTDQSTLETKRAVLEIFKGVWSFRSHHNTAISTHLRKQGRGKIAGTEKFSFDERVFWLKNLSETTFRHLEQLLPNQQ